MFYGKGMTVYGKNDQSALFHEDAAQDTPAYQWAYQRHRSTT